MNTFPETHFTPPRQRGLLFHAAFGLLTLGVGGWLLNLAALEPLGPRLVGELLAGLLLVGLAALAFYTLYALPRSGYWMDRDRLIIRMGWREEHLPLDEVLAAYALSNLEAPPPLPFLRRPGWLVGRRRWGNTPVEYFATDVRRLVFLQTPQRWLALSPEDPGAFLEALRRLAEQGSLQPVQPLSQRPLQFLADLAQDPFALATLLLAWGSGLALLVVVALGLPARTSGDFTAAQWVLLPVVDFLFLGMGLGMGLFAYRSPRRHWMAYPLWLSNALASLSFFFFALSVR